HYVDFSFKIKSSAMKLLTKKHGKDDSYMLFIILNNLNYDPQSHGRQWISKFSKMEVLMPNKSEQARIGMYFKFLDNSISLYQQKVEKLKMLKKSMLEKMFPKNGEKVPEV